MSNILIYSYVSRIYLIRHVKTYRVGIVMPTYIFNYPRDLDYYTSDYFFISTTNDLIPVRNDMINKPSPLPSPLSKGEGDFSFTKCMSLRGKQAEQCAE